VPACPGGMTDVESCKASRPEASEGPEGEPGDGSGETPGGSEVDEGAPAPTDGDDAGIPVVLDV